MECETEHVHVEESHNSNTQTATRCLKTQIIVAIVISVTYMACGLSLGHSAVLLPALQSNKSVIDINDKSASLIASVYTIVGPLGCILSGITMEIWGRQKNNFISSVGMLLGWILLSTANNASMMIWSRGIEGFFRAVLTTSMPVHFDEIADPKLRGIIFVLIGIPYTLGIMVMSGIGALVDWRIGCWISTAFALLSIVFLFLLHESPSWLVRKNKIKEAERSLNWIWGPGQERQANMELENMKRRYMNNITDISEQSSFHIKHLPGRLIKQLAQLLKPHIFKPFILLHIFTSVQVICGHNLLMYYTVDVIMMMKSSQTSGIDEYIANVIVSIARVLSIIILCLAMLRLGRRQITIISGIGSTASLILLSLILYLKNSIPPEIGEWISLSFFIIYVAIYSFGLYLLPTLMVGETQSAKVRSMVYGYMFTINDLLLGTAIRYYSSMVRSFQLQGLFLIFAASCFLCTLFAYLFLPETQGKSLEEIEDYFRKPNILWHKREMHEEKIVLVSFRQSNSLSSNAVTT